ncbi:MAG: NfeD family protein [Rubrobacteraceae bacterium]
MKHWLTLILALIVAVLAAGCGVAVAQSEEEPQVFVAEVSKTTDRNDALTEDTVNYLERVISDAEAADATVAIELSTSGGGLDQTQEIVGIMGEAKDTPIIVYVTPRSTRAASAGTFILLAGDVAAMAPETRTGAATPITFFGQDIPGDLGSKVRNDAVALITSLAATHDRNEEWAEKAVRDAEAVNAEEALELGVIEYVEPDLRSLLEAADGETVEAKGIELNTANAELVERSVSFKERFGFSRWYIIVPAILLLLFTAGLVFAVVRTSRARISTGREGMIGEVGTVRQQIGKTGGTVFVHGELWTALPEEPQMAPIESGTEVEIVSFRRTAIVVKPAA